jgi:Putative phage tail protein
MSIYTTAAQIGGTALGGPMGGAVAGFIAGGIESFFTANRPDVYTWTLGNQSFDNFEAYQAAYIESHTTVSGEQVRLQSGRVTRTSSFKQALPPRRRVYGTVDTGAPLFIHEVKSPMVYVGYSLSDGPIDAVTHVSICGTKHGITGNNLTDTELYTTGLLYVGFASGEDDQSVDSVFAEDTTSFDLAKSATYRQIGVARIAARLHYGDNIAVGGVGARDGHIEHNKELWGGKTTFEWTVRGIHVDLLTGSTGYSANPAHVAYDFLLCDWPGKLQASDLDLESFQDAATECAARSFEFNGVLFADETMQQSLQNILYACDGAIIRPNGQYKMLIDKTSASVLTIYDDDIIDPVQYSPDQSLDDAPNVIRATFGDGIGEVIVSDAERLIDNPERQLPITLDAVTVASQAEALTNRIIKRMARPTLSLRISDIGLLLQVLDVVTVQSVAFPEMSDEYKVLSIEPDEIGVNILLRGYNENDYAI